MTAASQAQYLRVAIDGCFHVAAKGGMSTYYRTLVKALAAHTDPRISYVIYVPGFLGTAIPIEMTSVERITWKVIHGSGTLWYTCLRSLPYYLRVLLWEHIILPWIVSKDGADVLHYLGNNAPLTRLPRTKVVSTIHDTIYFLFGITLPRLNARKAIWNAWYLRHSARIAATRASKIICDSYASKLDVIHYLGVPPSKIQVVHVAVDRDAIARNTQPEYLDRINDLRPDDVYFVASGSDSPHKNVERVLHAFKFLAAEEAGVKLVLTGTQWRRSALASIVRSLGLEHQVVITGYLPDEALYTAYKYAKGLVSVSLYEGFGLPAVEAMALGTPVIASDIPVMREIVGDAALFVDPTNVDEIAEAMQRLLEDAALVVDLRRRGFQQANKYSLGAMGKGTIEAYRAAYHGSRI